MNIIVLVDNYKSARFVHERNRYYTEHGITLKVVDPTVAESYEFEGIKVLTEKDFKHGIVNKKYDVLISHAPNIRNHYRFIKKHINDFPNLVFFFHGHEIVKCRDYYPKPYDYTNRNPILRNIYDNFKIVFWKKVFLKWNARSQYVFVCKWLYDSFIENIMPERKWTEGRTRIIQNCIGKAFQNVAYDAKAVKRFDFITIRSNLDSSTYCIDLVLKLAIEFPAYSFLIVGKGKFFQHYTKPENIILIEEYLTHQDMISLIQASRFALMPTRHDSQGVMSCELASIGMPLLTSDIPICREVFNEFQNVEFLDNNNCCEDFELKLQNITRSDTYVTNRKYFYENTCKKEVDLLLSLRLNIAVE
jgi:glycosyltransferase involved in cell wall biosynthesis